MFEDLLLDRPVIERKYHDPKDPNFDPFRRMMYHGYDYDPATGMTDGEIKAGLVELAAKTEKLPHPVAKARAVEYVLEHTRIDVNAHDYFIGIYSLGRLLTDTTIGKWYGDVKYTFLPELNKRRKDLMPAADISLDFDHVVPDFSAIMSLGFPGLLERARRYRREREARGELTEKQAAFFDGIEIEYTAILHFLDRVIARAEAHPHAKTPPVVRCLRALRAGAPTDTYEAAQLIFIYFLISECVDSYQVRSLGNCLDDTLYPFYRRDLESGRYTREELQNLLGYFMLQWSAIGNYWGQPLYLGGTDEKGNCKLNDLSLDIVDVYDKLGLYNPKIQIKVGENTPREFLFHIYDMIRRGHSSFVFCCEPGMTKAMMSYGATAEEARTMDIRGCYETGVRANEVSTCAAYINMLKCVEYAIFNGYDTLAGKQLGVQTGEVSDFHTFDDFYAAVLRQCDALLEDTLEISGAFEKYLEYVNPSSLYSATITPALEKAADAYQDGVKYNNTNLCISGLGTMVDAITAVKELVFERGETTMEELKKALAADWAGYEKLRLKALRTTRKYGNGDPEADGFADAISKFVCDKVAGRRNTRGGVYKLACHAALKFVVMGRQTLATPDGRHTGDEFSKNSSPSVGADRNGATALIRSVLAIKPYRYTESVCVDLMLHPSAVAGEEGLVAMDALLKTYMRGDGLSLQFNIFDAAVLRDAQAHPEKYENLQVRVAGWNALWNNLDRREQDAYILRAETAV